MSQMSTTAILKCKYCGKSIFVTELRTTVPDPEGKQLNEFMRNLENIKMCPRCQKVYNHYAGQGRSDEFIRGMLSPIHISI